MCWLLTSSSLFKPSSVTIYKKHVAFQSSNYNYPFIQHQILTSCTFHVLPVNEICLSWKKNKHCVTFMRWPHMKNRKDIFFKVVNGKMIARSATDSTKEPESTLHTMLESVDADHFLLFFLKVTLPSLKFFQFSFVI